jgi:hypothetical protein
MKRSVYCLSLIFWLVFGTSVFACGDKLIQIGRGLRYQRANSVRPATIVMLVGPHFDLNAANRLRSELSVVGHKVMIARDRDGFMTALRQPVDIVLAGVDDLAVVTERIDALSQKPTIVPMIDRYAGTVPAEIQNRFPSVLLLSSSRLEQVALISRVRQ